MAGNSKNCPIQNISKDTYLDKATAEVRDRVRTESQYQTLKSARKSIHRLMDLIRYNVTEASHSKWITVTYGEVMTDHKGCTKMERCFLEDYSDIWTSSQSCPMLRNLFSISR